MAQDHISPKRDWLQYIEGTMYYKGWKLKIEETKTGLVVAAYLDGERREYWSLHDAKKQLDVEYRNNLLTILDDNSNQQ